MNLTFSLRTVLVLIAIVSVSIVFQQAAGWLALLLLTVGLGMLIGRRGLRGIRRRAVTVAAISFLWMATVDLVGREYSCTDVSCDYRHVIVEARVLTFTTWKHESRIGESAQAAHSMELGYRFRLHGFVLPNPDLKLPARGIRSLTREARSAFEFRVGAPRKDAKLSTLTRVPAWHLCGFARAYRYPREARIAFDWAGDDFSQPIG